MNLIRDNLFAPEAFRFSPQLLNKLTTERFPDFSNFASFEQRPDYPIHEQILSLQTAALNRLFHPMIMSRSLDNELRVEKPRDGADAGHRLLVGSGFDLGRDEGASVSINSFRRSLQREHCAR